jgi:hypothetical protein
MSGNQNTNPGSMDDNSTKRQKDRKKKQEDIRKQLEEDEKRQSGSKSAGLHERVLESLEGMS